MRYFLLIVLSIYSCEFFAQSFKTAKDLSPKNQKLYQKSASLYKTDQFEKAKQGFNKLTQKEPLCIDAFIQLGSINYETSDFENAELNFKKAIALSPDYNSKVYYTLALSNRQTKKYSEAKNNLNTFIQTEKKNQELLNKAIDLYPSFVFADSITKSPLQFQLKEMTSWNTLHSEYLPTITADGNTVVFTRRLDQNNEDLFISTRIDSLWSEPKALDEINTLYNEGAPAISPDGKSIIFTSCDIKESIGGCDLFISELVNGEWSQPRNLSREINTPAYESQANFADNGNTLYFVSNRKGSLGANDIWVTKLKKDKTWSKPKNLGKNVNTIKNEECPFMHPNGKTLFFSSDGLPGMGGKDIYYCIKDTSNNWSEPINLGYPLNSTLHEASFITDIQGINAYYASDFKYENIKDQNNPSKKKFGSFFIYSTRI
jgi:tetratricopeptide (TPR) repeat protein